jgi:hypothetical protein
MWCPAFGSRVVMINLEVVFHMCVKIVLNSSYCFDSFQAHGCTAVESSVYVLMEWKLFHKHFTINPMATCLQVKEMFGGVFRMPLFDYFVYLQCFNIVLGLRTMTTKITGWINEVQFVAWEIFPPSRLWGPCCFLFHGCWEGWIPGVKWSEREADQLTPSVSRLRVHRSIPALLYILTAWYLMGRRPNFSSIRTRNVRAVKQAYIRTFRLSTLQLQRPLDMQQVMTVTRRSAKTTVRT